MRHSFLQWFAGKFLDRTLQPRELAATRQTIYGVLILVLLTGSFFWRRNLVEAQANELAVREESHGDLEMSGSILRLTLTGSQGLATCILWMTAIETEKKNQWSELEYQVRWLTRLQPHFITPWLFQSWKLAYNVSVESDRVSDKYFYITRGIQLLAEGELQNRDNPDIRSAIGFYTQHKITGADETNVHRSLLQLSCIPPNERDPARFRVGSTQEFNWVEFEKFCTEHPRLARRLREGLRREAKQDEERQFTCKRAEDVVQFLTDNWRVPSVFVDVMPTPGDSAWRPQVQDVRKSYEDRFPVLPPPRNADEIKPQKPFQATDSWKELTAESVLGDDVDGYAVARAWYGYAQEPIPDPDDFVPGATKEPEPGHRGRLRKPRYMATVLFRGQPALTQTHLSEGLQQEGWFDEAPWLITSWFPGDRFSTGPAEVSIAREHSSAKAWKDADEMWRKHGEANHLKFRTPEEEANTLKLAEEYWKAEGMPPNSGVRRPGPDPDPKFQMTHNQREKALREQYKRYLATLSQQERDRYQAARFLQEYNIYRRMSNFPHHLMRSRVEAEPDTVLARRRLFEADSYRLQASYDRALATYHRPDAIALWIKVLNKNPEYRDDKFIQESTFEIQLRYLDLINKEWGWRLKREVTGLTSLMGEAGQITRAPGSVVFPEILSLFLANYEKPPGTLAMFGGPFDILIPEDSINPQQVIATIMVATAGPLDAISTLHARHLRPLISPDNVRSVLNRKNLLPQSKPMPPDKRKQAGERAP